MVDKNIVPVLKIVRAVCIHDHNSNITKHGVEFEDLSYLGEILNYQQMKSQTDIEFVDSIEDRYNAISHSFGEYALGMKAFKHDLRTHSVSLTFWAYVNLTPEERSPYKELVIGRILGQLIIKSCLNKQVQKMFKESYSISNTTCYHNTKGEILSLLVSLPVDNVVIAMHEFSCSNYQSPYNNVTQQFK